MRPSRTHVQTTSDSPNWRRQHSTCNDKNDPSFLLLPLRFLSHLPLPLWTADISFNNKLTCNSNSAAYLAISQYQVRPMPFALHWVAYAAQNLVSRVHSTMYLCVRYICVLMCELFMHVYVCVSGMQVNLFQHKTNSCVSVASSGDGYSFAYSQVCCCSNFASVCVCEWVYVCACLFLAFFSIIYQLQRHRA